MLLSERSDVLLFGESVRALADVGQRANVAIYKFTILHETTQGIALPDRTVLGPFEDLFEYCHFHITESRENLAPAKRKICST